MRIPSRIMVCLSLLFAFLSTGSTLASEEPPLGDTEERIWMRSQEEEEALEKSGLLYEDKELEEYLTNVARKLQAEEASARFSVTVKVIKNPCLNAFAFPNGVIYVHTGILSRIDNEAQLATLLAHEITHATHKHALKAFNEIKKKADDSAAAQSALSGSVEAGNLGGFLGSTGVTASVSGYSRELEKEADRVGLGLVLRAGYDPVEALSLFGHLKKEIEDEKIVEPFFFATHPNLQERIRTCETFLTAHGIEAPSGIKNTEHFLMKTKGAILDNGWLDLKLGRFSAAQRSAEKYLTISPDYAGAYYLLGEIARQRDLAGDMDRAKDYYEKAITADPSCGECYKALGLIYYKAGEMSLAKSAFQSCLLRSPDTPDKAYIRSYLAKCSVKR
jgi:predicted Zn-dependent protease